MSSSGIRTHDHEINSLFNIFLLKQSFILIFKKSSRRDLNPHDVHVPNMATYQLVHYSLLLPLMESNHYHVDQNHVY